MSHRQITLDHARIDLLCDDVTSRVAGIERELERLERASAALSSQWDGAAREAYAIAHLRWDASMRELTEIAHALARIARRGNAAFSAHDRNEAAVWSL